MSGPKVVQDASIDLPNVGTVTAVDRVEAILSAVALAMGMTVDFIGAANSDDIMDGGLGGLVCHQLNLDWRQIQPLLAQRRA